MKIEPMIPIWLMACFCVALLLFKRKGVLPYVRQIIIVILLFAINLRIMVPDKDKVIKQPKIDAYVLFVIDDTISMLAEDGEDDQTRLEEVRNDADRILKNLNGANFAIMTFHNSAQIISPYTNNPTHIRNMLKTVSPLDEFYAKGSSFNVIQEKMEEQLKLAKDKGENTNVYTFFFSDGENNVDEEIESFAGMADYIDGGCVLGYGTKKGGPMQVESYSLDNDSGKSKSYLLDSDWETAISKIDEGNLEQIATDLGVEYLHTGDPDKLDAVTDEILENAKISEEELKEMGYNETYYFLIPPVIALLIWDFIHYKRKV